MVGTLAGLSAIMLKPIVNVLPEGTINPLFLSTTLAVLYVYALVLLGIQMYCIKCRREWSQLPAVWDKSCKNAVRMVEGQAFRLRDLHPVMKLNVHAAVAQVMIVVSLHVLKMEELMMGGGVEKIWSFLWENHVMRMQEFFISSSFSGLSTKIQKWVKEVEGLGRIITIKLSDPADNATQSFIKPRPENYTAPASSSPAPSRRPVKEGFLHFEAVTTWLGFVDDVAIRWFELDGNGSDQRSGKNGSKGTTIIQYYSQSRFAWDDRGQNLARLRSFVNYMKKIMGKVARLK
ncbi:hypothetical protein HK102_002864 [Quaeritorhiza haematococci]|nr:hypothetical protein HK102_002864 [Quaeritorhiza haematococci]